MREVEGKIQESKVEQDELKKLINAKDMELQEVFLQQDEGLCGCGVQCGSFGTASLYCTQSIVSLRLA